MGSNKMGSKKGKESADRGIQFEMPPQHRMLREARRAQMPGVERSSFEI